MRVLILAAAVASLGLAACQQSHSDAQEAAPAPKRDLGRSQVFYQGQGLIQKISTATVERSKTGDALALKVAGMAAGPGYKDAQFVPRIYPAPPEDGIYEVDVVATKPGAAAAASPTPIEVKTDWGDYPKGDLKGVRFMSATNHVEALVPAAK